MLKNYVLTKYTAIDVVVAKGAEEGQEEEREREGERTRWVICLVPTSVGVLLALTPM